MLLNDMLVIWAMFWPMKSMIGKKFKKILNFWVKIEKEIIFFHLFKNHLK